MNTYNPLADLLLLAVPLRMMEMQERGGPTDDDQVQLQTFAILLGEPEWDIALIHRVEVKSGTMFNLLAHTLAVMSYVPGGVTFAGAHYETPSDGSPVQYGTRQ